MKLLGETRGNLSNVAQRIRKRDFTGYTGLAIKNSIFQFGTSLAAKIGSLIFTAILARLLMPELFGLYSLALGTVLLFAAFSDLGTNQVFIKFVSRKLSDRKYKSAKLISFYIFKMKLAFTVIMAILLVVLSKFIAETYYQKPIYSALVAGVAYLLFSSLLGYLETALASMNKFRLFFYKEVVFQVSRLVLVPLTVLYALKFSNELPVLVIILALSFCFLFTFAIVLLAFKKEFSYLKTEVRPEEKLENKQKKIINNFVIALSVTVIAGVFFSYIDLLFLGRFVSSENIGFYKAAISLILAATPLVTFASALFPILSRLKGKRAERALRRAAIMTLAISVPAAIVALVASKLLISLVYGASYLQALPIFRLLVILLVTEPLIAVYSNFYISQNKPRKVTKVILSAIVVNIALNCVFVYLLLGRGTGEYSIVLGVTIAAIISRIFYLGMISLGKSKLNLRKSYKA